MAGIKSNGQASAAGPGLDLMSWRETARPVSKHFGACVKRREKKRSTLMKFEQFDIHRIMMGCDVCWLFGCVKDDARVHWPGTAEQRVFCCVGYPF